MSGQKTAPDFADNAEVTGQLQLKRGENQSQGSQSSDQSSYTSQATNLLQQTGEQVKNMAQGAADAVKNTLGLNNASNPDPNPNPNPNPNVNTVDTDHPSNLIPR